MQLDSEEITKVFDACNAAFSQCSNPRNAAAVMGLLIATWTTSDAATFMTHQTGELLKAMLEEGKGESENQCGTS